MTELSADRWQAIAQSWRRLGAIPPRDFDALRNGLADEVRELMRSDWAAVLIATLDEDPAGPLRGWRAKLVETGHVDAPTYAQMAAAMRAGLYIHDPNVQRLVADAGKTRVLPRVAPKPGPAPMREKLDAWGVSDQLCGILPMSPTVEVFLFATRLGAAPAFTEEEQRAFRAFLDGAEVVARHLARSHGMLGPVQLAPRQRQAVALLLHGMSEKEMAAELGVTQATAHEYVVEAYRRLNVRSRAELIALWLG
jgi:DNA-binding CsgD family transcriptional regulator